MHETYRVARVTAGSTTPLEKIQPDEATFFLYDHLGNTRVAFQVNGSNVPYQVHKTSAKIAVLQVRNAKNSTITLTKPEK